MNKFKKLIYVISASLFFIGCSEQSTNDNDLDKTLNNIDSLPTKTISEVHDKGDVLITNITIKVVELQDNQGLKYVGGEVTEDSISVYLEQLRTILGDDFLEFRENQKRRDHSTFHMTLINPYEYKELIDSVTYGEELQVKLLGLGKVAKNNQATYFVVAQSADAQSVRNKFKLNAKDFHVTLGFKPNDIYGVSKNKDTLIYK